MDPIAMLLDENNSDNILLYSEDGNAVEFEQVAVIELDNVTYALLHPLDTEDVADDEALVFAIDESGDEPCLVLCQDDDIVEAVFEEYYLLLDEA